MSYHPDLAAAEREEAEAEAYERHANANKAPRAEALLAEVQLQNFDHRLDELEHVLGMYVQAGREVTPEEEATVKRGLGPQRRGADERQRCVPEQDAEGQ